MPTLPLDTVQNTNSIGIAADHGGYQLKQYLAGKLREAGFEVIDFGDGQPNEQDDYPDFVVPLARSVSSGELKRGIAICGSGVGASIAANKVPGVRACLIHETFSAHQGVEDDNLNMICFGGLVLGHAMAWELLQTFLAAKFSGAERHVRRIKKVQELEESGVGGPPPAWEVVQKKLKHCWSNLTDSDLLFAEGEHEELLKRIEDRTGETRAAIEQVK